MNLPNALFFAVIGWVMEMLPKAFPSWFPHTGADASSGRALWLALMGFVQISLGLGFIVRAHLMPAVVRLVALVPSGESGALALPGTRGVTAR